MRGASKTRLPAITAAQDKIGPAGKRSPFDRLTHGVGQALPPAMRADMEARYGHDFGAVRIHTDRPSAKIATSLGARAFTVGSDITFAEGTFAPGHSAGRQLIAHELAHVVQQSRKGTHPPSNERQGADELDARQAAESATRPAFERAEVKMATARGAALDPDEDAKKKWLTQSMLPKGVGGELAKWGVAPVAAPPVIWLGSPPADTKFKTAVEATAVDWLAGKKPKTRPLDDAAAAAPSIVIDFPGFGEAFKEHQPTGKPASKPQLPKIAQRAPVQDARESFGDVRDDYALKLNVDPGGQVHHSIELQVLGRYHGVFTEQELNSLDNMRGIRPELGGKRQLHNAGIRAFWDRHYRALDDEIAKRGLKQGTPEYATYVRNYLEAARDESDYLYKPMFSESITKQLADDAAKAMRAKALADQTRQVINRQAMQRGLQPLIANPDQQATAFEQSQDFASKWQPVYNQKTGDVVGYKDKVRRFDESPLHAVDREGKFIGYGDPTPRFDTVPMIDPIDFIPFEMIGSMVAKGTLIGGRIVLKGIFKAGARGLEKEVIEEGVRIGLSSAEKAAGTAVADVVEQEVKQQAPRLFRIIDGELVDVTEQQAKAPLMRIINGELVEISEEEAVREAMRDLIAEEEEQALIEAAKEEARQQAAQQATRLTK